jgi:hypothetical protein
MWSERGLYLQFCFAERASGIRSLVYRGSSRKFWNAATKLFPLYILRCIFTVLEVN